MLTARELEQMRKSAKLSFPDTCTRQVSTLAADGMGGGTISWANTLNIRCKLSAQKLQGQGRETGEQFAAHVPWILAIPYDQTINSGDRVLFGGDTFEVVNVEDAQSFRSARRAYLRRID